MTPAKRPSTRARQTPIQSLDDLQPDPLNANRGTDRGREALRRSLHTYVRPPHIPPCLSRPPAGRSIVIDRRGRILGGHKTVEQAKHLGLPITVVPTTGQELVVVQRMDLDARTDPRAQELALADNRVAELDLDWDPAVLPAPWQDILDLAYYSGWRKQEILGLTWEEIDEAGGVIRLSPARSKTLVGRILPISPPIADALNRRRARRDPDSPLVFHRDGITIRRWRTAWRTACQAAGVPTRFLHDCRRTAARNLIRANVPERVAMLLTGHKSRAIFDRYNIINEQELLEAGDQLVAYLAQQAQAPRGRSHPASPRTASPLRLVRRSTA